MKILITGGTTFVSKFAAEYFVSKGNDVTVINRGSRPQQLRQDSFGRQAQRQAL